MTFRASLRRIGSETKLIINDGQLGNEKPRRDPALIKALARAHAWAKQLHAGKVKSLNDIAAAEPLARVMSPILSGWLTWRWTSPTPSPKAASRRP